MSSFASPVAEPAFIANNGDDNATVVLVGFSAVLLIGLIASVLLHWRRSACELEYTCVEHCNPVCHGRGNDGHNRPDAGVDAGGRNPFSGTDAIHQAKYGYGLSSRKVNSGIISNGGNGGSSML